MRHERTIRLLFAAKDVLVFKDFLCLFKISFLNIIVVSFNCISSIPQKGPLLLQHNYVRFLLPSREVGFTFKPKLKGEDDVLWQCRTYITTDY